MASNYANQDECPGKTSSPSACLFFSDADCNTVGRDEFRKCGATITDAEGGSSLRWVLRPRDVPGFWTDLVDEMNAPDRLSGGCCKDPANSTNMQLVCSDAAPAPSTAVCFTHFDCLGKSVTPADVAAADIVFNPQINRWQLNREDKPKAKGFIARWWRRDTRKRQGPVPCHKKERNSDGTTDVSSAAKVAELPPCPDPLAQPDNIGIHRLEAVKFSKEEVGPVSVEMQSPGYRPNAPWKKEFAEQHDIWK